MSTPKPPKFHTYIKWWVYLVRCSDDSLYCGITDHLKRRVKAHNEGKGSKYCRSRLPVKLVWWVGVQTKPQALQIEHIVKSLSKGEKEMLVSGELEALNILGDM